MLIDKSAPLVIRFLENKILLLLSLSFVFFSLLSHVDICARAATKQFKVSKEIQMTHFREKSKTHFADT